MYTDKTPVSDGVKAYLVEKESEELNKMYPKKDLTGKYKLYIQAKLWFPFPNDCIDSINAEVFLCTENGEKREVPKFKIRTPYVNKNIRLLSMKNGNRCSDIGLPLLFDTFADLCLIKRLHVIWSIKFKDSDLKEVYISAHYTLSFEASENRLYSIVTYEYPITAFSVYIEDKKELAERVQNYLNEYNGECFYYTSNNENSENICVRGLANVPDDMGDDSVQQKIFERIIGDIGLEPIYNALVDAPHFQFAGYAYSSTEIISADEFFYGL